MVKRSDRVIINNRYINKNGRRINKNKENLPYSRLCRLCRQQRENQRKQKERQVPRQRAKKRVEYEGDVDTNCN